MKEVTKQRWKRSISICLVCALLLCSPAADNGLLKGIFPELSFQAKAATGEITDTTKLNSVIKDSTLLTYLQNQVVATGYSGEKENITVREMQKDLTGALTIPSGVQNIEGLGYAYRATSINLADCTQVNVIPNGEFSDDASELQRVDLPTSVTTIGENAFKNCSKLRSVDLSQVTSIGADAFAGCITLDNSSVSTLKSTLDYLGSGAFQGCKAITAVSVPNITNSSLAHTVPAKLFSACTSLKEVTFCDSALRTISDSAFEGTNALRFSTGSAGTNFTSFLPGTVSNIGESAFAGSQITSLNLSNTQVTKISNSTFNAADLSEEIILPTALTEIGEEAFTSSKVTAIDMPNTVKVIGDSCFRATSKLASVKLSLNLEKIPNRAFQGAGNTSSTGTSDYNPDVSDLGTYTTLTVSFHGDGSPADSKLTEIGPSAFNASSVVNDSFLKGLTQLTTIDKEAFSYTDFVKLTIPACVTTLGEGAFNSLYYAEEVTFAAGSRVTEFPNRLFGDNKAPTAKMGYSSILLNKVQLPEQLETIGANCFGYCVSLETVGYAGNMVSGQVQFPSTLKTIDERAFYHCSMYTYDASETGFPNKFFGGALLLPNGGIRKVTIPNSVTTIGKAAFRECVMLEEMKIGIGVTEIPEEMCYGCGAYPDNKKEREYLLGEDGKPVASSPKFDASDYTPIQFIGLKKLTLPSGAEKIGASAFYQCFALEEITAKDGGTNGDLPDALSEIGNSAFYQCKSLKKVVFPTALKSIGDSAFAQAAQYIDEEYQPQNTKYTISHQYYGLETVDFRYVTQLETLGKNAFSKTNLTTISFPKSLAVLQDGICDGCYNLTTVTATDVTDVGNNAFKDCYKLNTVTLPLAANWSKTLFAGAAGNAGRRLTLIPTPNEEAATVIYGKDTQLTLNCLKNFGDTTLTVTDQEKDIDDPQNNLLEHDSNEYIRAKALSGNQIELYGKKMGETAIKVAGMVNLFNQSVNYLEQMSISITHTYNISVTSLPLTTLALSSTELVEEAGQRIIYMSYSKSPKETTVKADYAPADTTEQVSWKVDDTSIAEVSEPTDTNGVSTVKVKPVGAGDTVLHVYSNTKEDTCILRVRVPAKSIKLSQSSLTLATGAKSKLTATVEYEAGMEGIVGSYPDDYVFTSSDEAIVRVDPISGELEAVADGTATITVKCSVSGRSAICKVTVKAGYKPAVDKLTLSEKEVVMNVGEQKAISAAIEPADADQTVNWTSSNESIATVVNGTITALKPGSVNIAAADISNKKKATCKVTIKSPAKGLKIRAYNGNTSKIFVKKGAKLTLQKFYTNEDCTDTFKFSAKKSKVGSVTEQGAVTTKKKGKLVVFLTAYDKDGVQTARAKFTVNVAKKNKKAKKVKIKGTKKVLVGSRVCLQAVTTPTKATTAITWASSNTSVATVDSCGVVKGVKPGKVKITAKTSNKKKKSITVTVK